VRREDWLVSQLPLGMLDDELFSRFVSIFQEIATTMMENVDNIPRAVNPTVAPLPMVRWLGTWLGVDPIDSSLTEDLQRRFLLRSSEVLAWRGTARGLQGILEVVTGEGVEVRESGSIGREGETSTATHRVEVVVANSPWLDDDALVAVIEDEMPANVTFTLTVGGRRAWPREVAEVTGGMP